MDRVWHPSQITLPQRTDSLPLIIDVSIILRKERGESPQGRRTFLPVLRPRLASLHRAERIGGAFGPCRLQVVLTRNERDRELLLKRASEL